MLVYLAVNRYYNSAAMNYAGFDILISSRDAQLPRPSAGFAGSNVLTFNLIIAASAFLNISGQNDDRRAAAFAHISELEAKGGDWLAYFGRC